MWQNASQAANACMKVPWGVPDAEKLAKRAKELAEDGKIDDLSGLADDKVYLFSGDEDQTVERPVVEAAKRFYPRLGKEGSALSKGKVATPLSPSRGQACGLSEQPYVSDCDYDQAGRSSNGSGAPRRTVPADRQVHHFRLIAFSQGVATDFMEAVHVPAACETAPGCWLHIALMAGAGAGECWRRVYQGERLCPLRRHQPARDPFSADCGERGQSAWLLGLVGL
jgi:hypothetical protein